MKRARSNESSSTDASYATAEYEGATSLHNGPSTLIRGVSPPAVSRQGSTIISPATRTQSRNGTAGPTTAQVEAGTEDIVDHVEFFSQKLSAFALPLAEATSPRLSHGRWLDLYNCSQSGSGHHFVIHQHDHPVAGTHYDLRLQINSTSSISFAIMYGLPCNPNSRRLNRNATETRVHCLWNHLIETASTQTGTMLIWDTGEYEVLEKASLANAASSDTESDSNHEESFQSSFSCLSEPEKLASAFSYRKVRLRLHGTRLPEGYTVYLRLTKENDRSHQPKAPAFKRQRHAQVVENTPRRRTGSTLSPTPPTTSSSRSTSSDQADTDSSVNTQATRNSTHRRLRRHVSSLKRTASPPMLSKTQSSMQQPRLSQPVPQSPQPQQEPPRNPSTLQSPHAPGDEVAQTRASSQERIRLHNAYRGATNSVNSIHQRKWYLSLDRTLSGFHAIPTPSHIRNHHAKTYWVPILPPSSGDTEQKIDEKQQKLLKQSQGAPGFTPFHVLGREHERSVVTGRLAGQILVDEEVEGYVPRGRWQAVVE